MQSLAPAQDVYGERDFLSQKGGVMEKRASDLRNVFLSGVALLVLLYSTSALGQTIGVQVGDLDVSDQVTIDEMTKVIRMHLGYDPVQKIADYNGDAAVMINEIIMALNCYLGTGSCQLVSVEQSSPPTILDLRITPSSLPVPDEEGEYYPITIEADFEDTEGDMYQINTTIPSPDGIPITETSLFNSGETGTYVYQFIIDSRYSADTYQVSLEAFGEQGQSSGVVTGSFTLDAVTAPPVEITSIYPDTGIIGDTLQIDGSGFEADVPSKNHVYFSGRVEAPIVSATADQLEVIVPPGAMEGLIAVENGRGRAQSSVPFVLEHTLAISPGLTQIVVGQSVNFFCQQSGSASSLVWSVNGETSPDPEYGQITQDLIATYTAPELVPYPTLVTVRCTAEGNPSVYAEQEFEIILPPTKPGEAIITPDGGVAKSKKGEVTVTIPPDVLVSNTLVSVEPVNPDTLPKVSVDGSNLAAAHFSPDGLQFPSYNPAIVQFTLKHYMEPGTSRPLLMVDEGTGNLVNEGGTVVVDESGFKAIGSMTHFSIGLVANSGSASQRLQALALFERHQGIFSEFIVDPADGIDFLEGLSVPVRIRHNGTHAGPGPFLRGITVTPVLSGYTPETTPLTTGETIQPSGDGWEIGTVINIPTLPDCTEDQTIGATLYVRYPSEWGAAPVMQIPFTITCLCEIDISETSEVGQYMCSNKYKVEQSFYDFKYVKLSTGNSYQFSEITVGNNGALWVEPSDDGGLVVDPVMIEVTGDVVVESGGEIRLQGGNGAGGCVGRGNDDAGDGGQGGGFNAGNGGKGGYNINGGACSWNMYASLAYPLGSCTNDGVPDPICSCNQHCVARVINGDYINFCENDGCWGGNCGEYGYGSLTTCHRDSDCGDDTYGAPGGLGGEAWEKGEYISAIKSALELGWDIYNVNIRSAIEDGYELYQEIIKIKNNDSNRILAAGYGGYAAMGAADYYSRCGVWGWQDALDALEIDSFRPPLGGGGGGGGGKTLKDWKPDKAGGGGGGGGGGAASMKLVVGGSVIVDEGGTINGKGGKGGIGTKGPEKDSPTSGGGGGGQGAQMIIIADAVINNGEISATGGVGGAPGVTEVDGEKFLPSTGFGKNGKDGVLRIDTYPNFRNFGVLAGINGRTPIDCNGGFDDGGITPPGNSVGPYYVGPSFRGMLGTTFLANNTNQYLMDTYLGDTGRTSGEYNYRIIYDGDPSDPLGYSKTAGQDALIGITVPPGGQMDEGLHSVSLQVARFFWPEYNYITLHPWQGHHIFYYPDVIDHDGDGLTKKLEDMYGTSDNDPDQDNDGYSDGDELLRYNVNPYNTLVTPLRRYRW